MDKPCIGHFPCSQIGIEMRALTSAPDFVEMSNNTYFECASQALSRGFWSQGQFLCHTIRTL